MCFKNIIGIRISLLHYPNTLKYSVTNCLENSKTNEKNDIH